MSKRILIRIAVVVVLVAAGSFLLIRSLLSRHDERAAVGGGGGSQSASQFLVFEKDGKGVIFSLVRYDRTISYSRQGGSTRKSIQSTYYAQTNDLATAAKNGSEKIKGSGELKAYPVELLGAAAGKAWLFAGELMAWDPFSLRKAADAALVEEKNPALRGKLIHERRYYEFDNDAQQIILTAADGARYHLNAITLVAAPADEQEAKPNAAKKQLKELEQTRMETNEQHKKAYDRFREFNRQYREKILTFQQYKDSTGPIEKETRQLELLRDSLDQLIRTARNNKDAEESAEQMKEKSRRTGTGFSGMRLNSDTLDGAWYGLYTAEKLETVHERFTYQTLYDETARTRLYTAPLTGEKQNRLIGEDKQPAGDAVYLQGGFLPDKETGTPFHYEGGFLVVHKDRLGNEGTVQLTHVATSGRQRWTFATGLKEFYDWQLKGHRLVITGLDNSELSAGQVNVLLILDLRSGKAVSYDFFTDKTRN
jgi:hypothetical protein